MSTRRRWESVLFHPLREEHKKHTEECVLTFHMCTTHVEHAESDSEGWGWGGEGLSICISNKLSGEAPVPVQTTLEVGRPWERIDRQRFTSL